MEAILSKLKAKAKLVPDNSLLQDTVSLLTDLVHNPAIFQQITWEALIRDFERLQDQGLWDLSEDNNKLLHALRSLITTNKQSMELDLDLDRPPVNYLPRPSRPVGKQAQQTFSTINIIPPSESPPSPLLTTSESALLPLELLDLLNHTYFLHLLATDPNHVIPPGKSLISMMSHSPKDGEDVAKLTLHDKVEDLVHKAFWDEAIESLSNPEPSYQLLRIKLLYNDLHIVLTPLLPTRHPVITTLTSPLSPTSSPLDSAIIHLREVVMSLRERCAPIRDQEFDDLLHTLDEPPLRSSRPIALATLVADTVKSIFKVSEIMKDDLSQFVLGSMTEQQLQSAVSKQAKTRERDIILDIWKPDQIENGWQRWLDNYRPSFQVSGVITELRLEWIVRLVQALGSSIPVSSKFPGMILSSPAPHIAEPSDHSPLFMDNSLPPIFFFSVPALLRIQNYLQALVIAASLNSLTRLSPRGGQTSDVMSVIERIWIMLKAEIIGEHGSGDTKLVHLADEVIRAHQLDGAILSADEEARLRAAVDRTLNPGDPVFVLLQKRVLKALVDALGRQRSESRQDGRWAGPQKMQTGLHGERARKRLRLVLDPEDFDAADKGEVPQLIIGKVQGFEHEYLMKIVEEVFGKVDECVRWVEGVWKDVVEVEVVGRGN